MPLPWSLIEDGLSPSKGAGLFQADLLDAQHLAVFLIDGTAQSALHLESLHGKILPGLLRRLHEMVRGKTLYVVLMYGDYPPVSRRPCQQIYVGQDHKALLWAIGDWCYAGGRPIGNALQEGLAAMLETLDLYGQPAKGAWLSRHAFIVLNSPGGESGRPERGGGAAYSGWTLEELLGELKTRSVQVAYAASSPSLARTFDGTFSKAFGVGRLEERLATATRASWVARWSNGEQEREKERERELERKGTVQQMDRGTIQDQDSDHGQASDFNYGRSQDTDQLLTRPLEGRPSSAPRPGEMSDIGNVTEGEIAPSGGSQQPMAGGSTLEVAARQFLMAVLKLPQSQRAAAIKRHLESPAYSTEYKQCLVTMVRQMQTAARRAGLQGTEGTPSYPESTQIPTSSSSSSSGTMSAAVAITRPPSQGTTRSPLWIGRLAFIQTNELLEVAAFPCPNPKSIDPTTIPAMADYQVELWPAVLSITSFVPIHSPAVAKSVPISKLLELVPHTSDPSKAANNNESGNALRNLLTTRHVVGLARLGTDQAMLVAARPHQLVGMVITRHAAMMASSEPFIAMANPISAAPFASASTPLSTSSVPIPATTPLSAPIPTSTHLPPSAPTPNNPSPSPSHHPHPHLAPPAPPQMPPRQTMTRTAGGDGSKRGSILNQPTTLTPDAILRQHRPGSAAQTAIKRTSSPMQTESPTNTPSLDVFNALMSTHEWEGMGEMASSTGMADLGDSLFLNPQHDASDFHFFG